MLALLSLVFNWGDGDVACQGSLLGCVAVCVGVHLLRHGCVGLRDPSPAAV